MKEGKNAIRWRPLTCHAFGPRCRPAHAPDDALTAIAESGDNVSKHLTHLGDLGSVLQHAAARPDLRIPSAVSAALAAGGDGRNPGQPVPVRFFAPVLAAFPTLTWKSSPSRSPNGLIANGLIE